MFMASYDISKESGIETQLMIVAEDTIEQVHAMPENSEDIFSDWQVVSGQDGIIYEIYYNGSGDAISDGENAAYCLRAELNNTTMDAGIMHYITISLIEAQTENVLFELQSNIYSHTATGGTQ